MNVSTTVPPAAAGAIVPRNRPPICAGSGWVYRMPSGVMTTTKSVPVSRWTCSASGWSTEVGSGAERPDTTTGAAARVWAMPRTSSCAASELAVDALEKAASPVPSSTTRITAAWKANSWVARLQERGPRVQRADARGPRGERGRSSSLTSPPARPDAAKVAFATSTAPQATLAACRPQRRSGGRWWSGSGRYRYSSSGRPLRRGVRGGCMLGVRHGVLCTGTLPGVDADHVRCRGGQRPRTLQRRARPPGMAALLVAAVGPAVLRPTRKAPPTATPSRRRLHPDGGNGHGPKPYDTLALPFCELAQSAPPLEDSATQRIARQERCAMPIPAK